MNNMKKLPNEIPPSDDSTELIVTVIVPEK